MRLVCVLSAALLVLGCETRQERRQVVPDSLLVAVLADLHLADARARIPGEQVEGLRDSVLRHHGMTEERFGEAMGAFADHPGELGELYNSVLDRLSQTRITP